MESDPDRSTVGASTSPEEGFMKLIDEFKQFAIKGNVVDMAVGVIIGAAFSKIVSSLVADVVTPPLGLLVGGVNFSHLAVPLREAIGPEAPAVMLKYGVFLQAVFDFMIVAIAVFAMVKLINRLRRQEEAKPAPPPEPPKQELLLAEIRDLLKQQRG
jgi:large conductance mechanosensitive channel